MNSGSELKIKISVQYSGKMSMVKTKEIWCTTVLGTHQRDVFLHGDNIHCNKMEEEAERVRKSKESLQSDARINTEADLSLFVW